jgi:branched-chain amino acid transport system substrate-binding protein
MAKYNPEGDLSDPFNVYGYTVAATLEQVLKQCGDTLTRENVMKQAANLKRFRVETLLPGITISTSPSDFAPIEAVQLERFNGHEFELFGEVLSSEQ